MSPDPNLWTANQGEDVGKWIFAAALAASISAMALTAPAQSTVLDFEGINNASQGANIPVNYGNFNWVNGHIFRENGPLVPTSGEWLGRVSETLPTLRVRSANPFTFVGAYFVSLMPGNSFELIGYRVTVVDGLDVKEVLYSEMLAPGQDPAFITLNFEGINELYFNVVRDPNDGQSVHIGFDDFTFEGDPMPLAFTERSVSEAQSLTLFAVMLVGFSLLRRSETRQCLGPRATP